jgi:hypothetical protein
LINFQFNDDWSFEMAACRGEAAFASDCIAQVTAAIPVKQILGTNAKLLMLVSVSG